MCFRFKDSRSSILQEDPYILHDNGTLEIRVAQAQHSGKYTCVATNELGIYENHVYMEVKGKNLSISLIILFAYSNFRPHHPNVTAENNFLNF